MEIVLLYLELMERFLNVKLHFQKLYAQTIPNTNTLLKQI